MTLKLFVIWTKDPDGKDLGGHVVSETAEKALAFWSEDQGLEGLEEIAEIVPRLSAEKEDYWGSVLEIEAPSERECATLKEGCCFHVRSMTDQELDASSVEAREAGSAIWTVFHMPGGQGDAVRSLLGDTQDAPVSEEQAWVNAEHTHGGDFGTVLALYPGDDEDASVEAFLKENPSYDVV